MKDKFPLLSAGIMLSISLILLVTASVAWFSINDRTSSNVQSIKVDQVPSASYTMYRYDTLTDTVIETSDVRYISLNQYDSIFTQYNAQTSVILKIESSSVDLHPTLLHIDREALTDVECVSGALRFTVIMDGDLTGLTDADVLYNEFNNRYYDLIFSLNNDYLYNNGASIIDSRTFGNDTNVLSFNIAKSKTVFLYITYIGVKTLNTLDMSDEIIYENDIKSISIEFGDE